MSRSVDRWQPRYVDTSPVASGATLTGPVLGLEGAAGFSLQVTATNGAAGTVNVDVTNQDGAGQSFLTPSSQTVAANGVLFLNFGPADQATMFAQMRVRFVASAAGNVSIATMVRRYTP